jgi:outer membrane protein assembly factor BamB
VTVDSDTVVLAAHKSRLTALPQGSSTPLWQFPPRDRNSYPLSAAGRDSLTLAIDALDLESAAKANLADRVDDVTVSGPNSDALKESLDALQIEDRARDDLKQLIDEATERERRALSKVRALYGDLGVSEDGNTVYVPTFGGWLFSLDASSGETNWMRDMGAGMVGGVAVNGDTLYLGTKDGEVYALDAVNGASRWSRPFEAKGEIWSTPVFLDDALFVTSLDGTVYRLNGSGEEEWSFQGADAGIAATPVFDGERLYVGAFDNHLYALDAADGRMLWSFEGDNWFWGSPALGEGVVYAAGLDSKLYALDAESGDERWDNAFEGEAPFRAGPLLTEDGLVVADRDGLVYKVDPETGEGQGPSVDLGSRIESPLSADDDGNVYVVPRQAELYVIETDEDLAFSSFPLP